MENLAQIVQSAQKGDTDAFNMLVGRFGAFAHERAFAWLGDHHRAEEVVQEAFLEAALKLHQLKSPHAFSTWFKRIVVKHCDRITRRKSLSTVELAQGTEVPDSAVGPVALLDAEIPRTTMQEAMRQLRPAQRDLLHAVYWKNTPQKEIAATLGVPLTTVKKRVYDARQKLAQALTHFRDHLENDPAGVDGNAFPDATQLFMAAWHGHRAKLQTLLSAQPALRNAQNSEGLSLLLFAAHAAHYSRCHDISTWLLGAGADTDLFSAAALGLQRDVVRALRTDAVDRVGPWQRTALHWAVCGGHLTLVKLLLERGADPNRADHWGCTSVHLAVDFGQADVLDLILSRGGDPRRIMGNGKNLLHLAACQNNHDVLERVRHAGLRLDIFTAAALGHVGLAERLLHEDQSQLSRKLRIGATPLQIAAERGHQAMTEYLLSRGAPLDPISAIALDKEEALFDLLERQPASVDRHAGSFGFTPLHAASVRGRNDLVRHLLRQGADVNRSDRMFQKTPMEEALFFGKESAARLLHRHGGRLAAPVELKH